MTEVTWVARSIGDERLRGRVVLLLGVAIGVFMAFGIGGHLLDEMPLALLAGWGAAVIWLARVAGRADDGGVSRVWPAALNS